MLSFLSCCHIKYSPVSYRLLSFLASCPLLFFLYFILMWKRSALTITFLLLGHTLHVRFLQEFIIGVHLCVRERDQVVCRQNRGLQNSLNKFIMGSVNDFWGCVERFHRINRCPSAESTWTFFKFSDDCAALSFPY